MKKLIFFIVGFTISFVFLTIYSTHRVYIEVETNAPQAIQITNWGKSFDHIKYPEKNKVTFWHRFHTINDNINFELLTDDVIEITAIKAAGKTYTPAEIEKAITGKINIEHLQFNPDKNTLGIKPVYRIEKQEGILFTDIPALTDQQKRFKYVPLIFSLIAGTILFIYASKISSFACKHLEKSPWIETSLSWIEARTTRDFITIAIILIVLAFGYLTTSPPLTLENINVHHPYGAVVYQFFIEDRLFGLFLVFILPLFDNIPFFLSICGCVFLFLAAYAYTKLFHCTPIQKFCVYLILLTFPTWSYACVYFHMAVQMGCFAMLAMISFYYFIRNNNGSTLPKRDFFISFVFFFFACWGYETTPTIFFVLLATWILTIQFNQLNLIQIIKQGFYAAIISSSALLCSIGMAKLIRILTALPHDTHHVKVYSKFSSETTISTYLSTVLEGLMDVFHVFPWDWYVLIWFILIPVTCLVVLVKSQKSKILIQLLTLLLMIITPFLLTFLLGAPTPMHACVAYPFMVTGMAFILLYHTKTRWIIFFVVCLCVAIMFKSTFYINKRTLYDNKLKNKNEFLVNKVMDIIYEKEATDLPVIFIGSLGDTVETHVRISNLHFYNGNCHVLFYYYNHKLKASPKTLIPWAEKLTKNWPSFPKKECAKVVDSVMIIKLSESTFKDDCKSN